MTCGEGDETVSATAGVRSRMEKFTAKMKTQTAASPPQAAG